MVLNKINKALQAFLITTASVIIVIGISFLEKSNNSSEFIIGCPNSIGGMITNFAVKYYCGANIGIEEDPPISAYLVADCCSPKTGISLTSGELQGAVMCPDSAKELVEKDDRFMIVSDFTFNTEIIVFSKSISSAEDVKKIGYMNGQERQRKNLEALYGDKLNYIPIMATSLPYALELGEVDAAVLDFGTGLQMDNDFIVLESDIPTTVLVIAKDFYGSEQYEALDAAIAEACKDLDNFEGFSEAMHFLSADSIDGKEFEKWLSLDRRYPKK